MNYQPDHLFAASVTAAKLLSRSIEAYPVERLGLSDHAPIVIDLDVAAGAPEMQAGPAATRAVGVG
jgi:hypothetical protein